MFIENKGFCVICEKDVKFSSHKSWLRDSYLCSNCNSIPRERALMKVINEYYPDWKKLKIHESSPAKRGVSSKLKEKCKHYVPTQFYMNKYLGKKIKGFRNENLENQTFKDETFDLIITQDVMEHVFNPDKAFKEIARTLKVGGSHVFTVPLVNKQKESSRRAKLDGNVITHFKKPQYHGNPINHKGSLVTYDWGYDISEFIFEHSGLYSTIIKNIDRSLGIDAEYIEVIISKKIK